MCLAELGSNPRVWQWAKQGLAKEGGEEEGEGLRAVCGLQIWDLESKSIVDELRPEFLPVSKKAQLPFCICLNWSADGSTLYSGYTDGKIRVWGVGRAL